VQKIFSLLIANYGGVRRSRVPASVRTRRAREGSGRVELVVADLVSGQPVKRGRGRRESIETF
jgi:hypothetical protein